MDVKKNLGLGLVSAILGFALIGGGTFAYFSDAETTNNRFSAGTLDLSVSPTVFIDMNDLKPGDTMLREFILSNDGSLDIKSINLETDYNVLDIAGDNEDDLGKHIKVNFLWNWDQESEPIFETTLYDLKAMDPDVVKRDIWDPLWEANSGLHAGDTHEFWVEFEFVDNGENQNMFQGDSLALEWTFNAKQADGEER